MNDQLFGQTGLNVSQIALRTGNFGTGYGFSPDANQLHKGNSRKAMLYSIEQSLCRY